MTSFSLDSETALIQPGLLAPPPACFSWGNEIGGTGLFHASNESELARLLDTATRIVGANFAYDAAVICERYPALMSRIFDLYQDRKIVDIQLSQMLIDIAAGRLGGFKDHRGFFHRYSYSLDALTQRYGGAPLDKVSFRLGYGQLIDVPLTEWSDGQKAYPEKDAGATMFVDRKQQEWDEYLVDSANQAAYAFPLHLMSCYGLRTDPGQVQRVKAHNAHLTALSEKTCIDAKIVGADGKRKMAPARALLAAAFDARGEDIPLTATGVAKAGVDSLPLKRIQFEGLEKYISLDEEACLDSGVPALEAFSIFGSAKGRVNKVAILEQGTRIALQTRFEVLKETGRTSSKAPGDPLIGDNFQNFSRGSGFIKETSSGFVITPSPNSDFVLYGPYEHKLTAEIMLRDIDVRGCIIPRPGFVICSVDYDGAELHTLAQVCIWAVGQSRLAEVLNAGKDPHLLLGAERLLKFKLSYEDALKRKREPEVKHARQTAKVPNFGLPGGLGAKGLRNYAKGYGVILSQDEAESIIEAWHETWPEMREYFRWIRQQSNDGLATIRQFVSGRVRGLCTYTQACNSYFQGLAADGAKSALLPLARECYLEEDSPLFGSRPILFIHDEVIAEIPEDLAHLAAPRMAEIMIENFNKYVPDCPVTASPALMRRWDKAAEPVYDPSGRLAVWEPKAA